MPTLCDLPALLARIAHAVPALPPPRTGFALVEHAWHLADLETEAFQVRLGRMAREDVPWLADFDGDRAAEERSYRARSLHAGVRAFAQARARTVRRLAALPRTAWLRAGLQEHAGYVTLGELPDRILAHDRAHARELAALLVRHPLGATLRRWAAAIPEPAVSPCNRRGELRARTASPLPLAAVQRAITACAGDLRTATLARALQLSPRTLQRRLADHGLTAHCVLEEARRSLALGTLRAGADWRTAAEALGFAAPRAFARAFKRWTRATPHDFDGALPGRC